MPYYINIDRHNLLSKLNKLAIGLGVTSFVLPYIKSLVPDQYKNIVSILNPVVSLVYQYVADPLAEYIVESRVALDFIAQDEIAKSLSIVLGGPLIAIQEYLFNNTNNSIPEFRITENLIKFNKNIAIGLCKGAIEEEEFYPIRKMILCNIGMNFVAEFILHPSTSIYDKAKAVLISDVSKVLAKQIVGEAYNLESGYKHSIVLEGIKYLMKEVDVLVHSQTNATIPEYGMLTGNETVVIPESEIELYDKVECYSNTSYNDFVEIIILNEGLMQYAY